ncbi:MAG: hypothetical protein GQ574_11210 [Crocinitomix sp.]|nr:hypothetical protein [Crocinitomix sp.]
MKFIGIICVLFILMISCKKESAVSFDTNFEGEWHTLPYGPDDALVENYIIINGESGVFGQICDIETFGTGENCSIYSGPAIINNAGTKLLIGKNGNGDVRIVIKIVKLPYMNADGIWQLGTSIREYYREP